MWNSKPCCFSLRLSSLLLLFQVPEKMESHVSPFVSERNQWLQFPACFVQLVQLLGYKLRTSSLSNTIKRKKNFWKLVMVECVRLNLHLCPNKSTYVPDCESPSRATLYCSASGLWFRTNQKELIVKSHCSPADSDVWIWDKATLTFTTSPRDLKQIYCEGHFL